MDHGTNCVYLENDLTCYYDFNYKKLQTNIVVISEKELFIKSNLEWLEIPDTRSYDLIGFNLPPGMKIKANTYRGKQIYTAAISDGLGDDTFEIIEENIAYNPSATPSYFATDNLYGGIVLTQNLVNDEVYYSSFYGFTVKQSVLKLQHSVWAVATTYEFWQDGTEKNLLDTASEYTISGLYKHAHTSFSWNSFSFGIGVPASAGISVGGSYETKFETQISVPCTIYAEEINVASPDNADIENPVESFFNRNNVFISSRVRNTLIELGFSNIEIDYLTASEYDKYKSYIVLDSESKVKESSPYKQMTVTGSELANGNYFIKVNLLWKIEPNNRHYDIIGLKIPSNSTIHGYSGKQFTQKKLHDSVSVTNYSQSLTPYFSVNNYGVAMKHNLDDSDEYLFITLQVEGVRIESLSDNRVDAYFYHQIDNYNISNTEFWSSYNIVGFSSSTIANKYDGLYSIDAFVLG